MPITDLGPWPRGVLLAALVALALPSVAAKKDADPATNTTATSVSPTRLVVLDVELIGDLGGPAYEAQHEARLKMASALLREQLSATRLYEVADNSRAAALIESLKARQSLRQCNGCEFDIAKELDAQQVLVPWVYRVSNLILTLNYEIRDVAMGETITRKAFDFRGDNDAAWRHAITYMVRDLKERVARPPER
jgi:hypothetical protein